MNCMNNQRIVAIKPVALSKSMLLIAVAVALSACSMAPKYERPIAPISSTWNEVTSETNSESQSVASHFDWQRFIVDERLRKLVGTALENNRDLVQTALNVDAARAQYRIQRADRLPTIGVDANGVRQRLPADLNTTGSSVVQSSYQAGLGLTAFELDLFGRVRSLSQAALHDYLAVEANAQSIKISLIAEVIQAYLVRDGAHRRKALVQQTLASRQKSLELIGKRRESGAVSALDFQEALGLAEQANAEYERVDRELRQASNALQLLVGVPDVVSNLPDAPMGVLLVQQIQAGAPSDLLANRPDVVAAEYQLKARNANIGAARAAFFPRISLTALLGSSSAELSNLFEGGQRSWSFTPQLTLPIFDAGRNQSNLDLATVRKDVAIAQYEKAIQVAFREVSDALAATDTLRREETSRRSLAASSMEAQRLSEARYRGGVDGHLRYLEAQRSAFSNQMTYIEVSTQRQVALVSLFKSLGGGWTGTVEQ